MSIIGIVCEYNPFHNGHEYHIMMSKKQLAEDAPVICVMSGDFVQRGEPATYSKFARAEAACLSGADLVIELPLPWALASAEGFARGAVSLLSRLGATHISFGSEAGETEPLEIIARTLVDPLINAEVKQRMSEQANLSYAAARQQAVEQRLGELGRQLELPNNILAVEYLKAIYDMRLELIPMTVQRFGSGHDKSGSFGPKSAAELRKYIAQGKSIEEFVPAMAMEVYRREERQGREHSEKASFETAMISRLRMFDEEYFCSLPDAGDGLGNRLYRAVREEARFDAMLASAKTKRYPLSRIRRIYMCACLGIKAGMSDGVPPYARVLAANETGCRLLREINDKAAIPMLTKPASVKSLSANCTKLFALGAMAHDFFVLGYRASDEKKGGKDWRSSPRIV